MRALLVFLFLATAWGTACVAGGQDAPPAADVAVGDMTVHVIPQSHIDLAWWWRYDPETLRVIAPHTLETAFGNLEKFPDYTFTYLQVPAIAPLETLYPDLFYKLRYYSHNRRALGESIPNPRARGANGRLAIGSAAWCEFDGCVPGGEALVRHFLYGKRYFQHEFGIDVKTAWVQDAWTHPWTLPQIMKKCGVESYMFTRPRGQGDALFWWEAPDGSRVLAYKPVAMENGLPPQAKLEQSLRDLRRRYGVHDGIVLVGVGNHGGGVIRADVARMRDLMGKRLLTGAGATQLPMMRFSTPQNFVDAVLKNAPPLPTQKNELTPTIRGAYTTVGEIKTGNRRSECLLATWEKFAAIAAQLGGRPYPRAALRDAWHKVLLNQFHDTISGADIRPATDDALRGYAEVAAVGETELRAALQAICARINTAGRGEPVVVFNPLAWKRTDVVTFAVPRDASSDACELFDAQGVPVATQIVGTRILEGKPYNVLAFVAHDVPSLGYTTYWHMANKPSQAESPPSRPNEIENAFFRVQIDPATGQVSSVFDKENRREVLAKGGQGGRLQIFEDLGDSEGFLRAADGQQSPDVWGGKSWDVAQAEIAVVERGPVRTTIEVKHKFELARFSQRIALYAGMRRIDFALTIDWNGANKMVKVGFPLAVSCPNATYEIPYGAIRRASLGEEQAAQNWVDISADGYGVSLLNDCRYGCDVAPNMIRLSLLRSPTGPVCSTDEGLHRIGYALYPHAGDWRQAHVVRRGQEFNNPLLAVNAAAHSGDLPAAYSFISTAPENVVLSALKYAEDSDQLVARCCETAGQAAAAQIYCAPALAVQAVHAADLLENSQRDLPVRDGCFSTETPAWSIDTYKLLK